jgi:membrane-associated phospholipid phosphatase
MPLLIDVTIALAAGTAALLMAILYARSGATPARPSLEVARAVGQSVRPHRRLRRLIATRLDRGVATGLLLTLALSSAFAAAVLVGILVVLLRSVPALQHLDNSVAVWAFDQRSSASTKGLHLITDLGSAQIVLLLAVVLVIVDFIRTRDRWCAPFLIVVLGGRELLTLGVKDLVGRVRPALDAVAATLGPSFPSGHSATAAAFYAAAALILGRRVGPRGRAVLVGLAVAVAVGVAASRVLLDLHWLTDVLGGLALGWGWFVLCAAIFGGRLLRPTVAIDTAAAAAREPSRRLPGSGDPQATSNG